MSDFGSLGRPAEILLVEDNLDDVNLTKLAFDEIDIAHRLHVVHDGQQAMEFLRHEGGYAEAPHPDLILLDLNMPLKDGREVLKDIKQSPDLRRIPVIILTMSDSAVDRLFTYAQHANAYLVKPLELEEWFEMLRVTSLFWLKFVRHSPLPASRRRRDD